jgi:hypothetical protein
VRSLFQKLELAWPENFETRLPTMTLRNDKWRKTISESREVELRQEDPAFLAPLEDPA